ncbi:hypothetical protein H2200_003521 [Cladophialophora chaetospira]|uniref:ML-like domain-containing protein n=1 Tax=Cladophialophora chaetospira TaxID=386627 RepID=A0AA39CLH4_9EURO|nr:hypothetical protein H2200_003521 [Cladophialophora chaetospira]
MHTRHVICSFLPFAALFGSAYSQISGPITCSQGAKNNIVTADIANLAAAFQAGNVGSLSDPIDMLALSKGGGAQVQASLGSVQVLLDNNFIFESTHVSFATVAQALLDLKGQCCGDFDTCIPGSGVVKGDTGLQVDFSIAPFPFSAVRKRYERASA